MPDRLEIDITALTLAAAYPLLNACVVPRPIAWVVTRSADGVDNLAPHSYFTVSSIEPPIVQITAVGDHDTLRNARATGELVVCASPRGLADAINLTATDFPPDVSEIDMAGLTREPSVRVAPPRVAESPVALECRLAGEQTFGLCTVVFAEVLHVAVDRSVADADGHPDPVLLAPAARLGKNFWAGLGEIWDLPRVPYAEWKDGGAGTLGG
jgi:flavin reductase (DIM6/NTAB) family NADH-FMN oxidoreductase RutF